MFSRENFNKVAMATILGLFLHGEPSPLMSQNSSDPISPSLVPTAEITPTSKPTGTLEPTLTPTATPLFEGMSVNDLAELILAKEKSFGEKELTFEDAQSLLPAIAGLFAREYGEFTGDTTESIFKKIILLRQDLYSSNEEVEAIKQDYPDVEISPGVKHKLMSWNRWGGWVAMSKDGFVWIKIPDINETAIKYGETDFLTKGFVVECHSATPSILLRSVITHEMEHNIVEEQGPAKAVPQQLSDVLQQYFSSLDDKYKNLVFTTRGFHILVYDKITGELLDSIQNLNEFVTDHLAQAFNNKYNFPYVMRYGRPSDHANFDLILRQAGISDKRLLQYALGFDVEGFLIDLASSAHSIHFDDDVDRLNFTLGSFLTPYSSTVDIPNSTSEAILGNSRFYDIKVQEYYYRLNKNPDVDPGTMMGCSNIVPIGKNWQ